jgi:putative ABC transport system permease protein
MSWKYFTIAIRNLAKNKLFSGISIGGLALGIAASTVILLFVQDELGYDAFIEGADRTYRMEVSFISPDRQPEHGAAAQGALAPALIERSPLIESGSRLISGQVSAVQIGDELFSQDINYADPNFLNFIGVQALSGSVDAASLDQNSIVLTESIARRFFGEGPVLGETMVIDSDFSYRVVAVIPDFPDKTHLAIEALAPFHAERHDWLAEEWTSGNTFTYFRLIPGADPSVIPELAHKVLLENVGQPPAGFDIRHNMVPVKDIHLHSSANYDMKPGGSIETVFAFFAVAILVLIIACVNYINLATAQAATRTREVGVRKVFGAGRKTLVTQFLSESVLVTFCALLLGLGLADLLLPYLNSVLDRSLDLNILTDFRTLPIRLFISHHSVPAKCSLRRAPGVPPVPCCVPAWFLFSLPLRSAL